MTSTATTLASLPLVRNETKCPKSPKRLEHPQRPNQGSEGSMLRTLGTLGSVWPVRSLRPVPTTPPPATDCGTATCPSPTSPGPPTMIDPGYWNADDVAKLLKVSPRTIYRWVEADPTLPALRIAGSLRFPRGRLLRWLQQREQGQTRPRSAHRSAHDGDAQPQLRVVPGGEPPAAPDP
jgi:excisionase family DNA binding protein